MDCKYVVSFAQKHLLRNLLQHFKPATKLSKEQQQKKTNNLWSFTKINPILADSGAFDLGKKKCYAHFNLNFIIILRKRMEFKEGALIGKQHTHHTSKCPPVKQQSGGV